MSFNHIPKNTSNIFLILFVAIVTIFPTINKRPKYILLFMNTYKEVKCNKYLKHFKSQLKRQYNIISINTVEVLKSISQILKKNRD